MKATLMLMNTTAAGPLLLVLLLPWDATTARPVLLWLLLLRHTNTARYHMVIPSLSSDSHGPPVPKTTIDDKSMGGRWTFRELAENELNDS